MNRVPRNQLGFGLGPHALSSRSPGGSWRTREKLDLRRTGAALIPPRSHRDLKTAERPAVGPISILVRHLPLYLVLKILFPVLFLPHSSFVYCRPWLLIMYLRLRLRVLLFLSISKNAAIKVIIKIIKVIKFNAKTALGAAANATIFWLIIKKLSLISISIYCVLKS